MEQQGFSGSRFIGAQGCCLRKASTENAVLTLGEVCTGLLQNSAPVTPLAAEQLLTLTPGEQPRCSERPISYAVSPDLLTGIDCRLATRSGARVRGVGTVLSRAMVVGGHVLQGSAFVQVVAGKTNRRLQWSHYLSRPGVVDMINKADPSDLVDGFAGDVRSPTGLDLDAISNRLMDSVQASSLLDRRPPFRAARTAVRWVVTQANDAAGHDSVASISFFVDTATVRTLRLMLKAHNPLAVAEACEDIAMHDWLLTTLLILMDRSRVGAVSTPEAVDRLRPAINYLLHLWMPGARLDRSVEDLWASLERSPGFTKQWTALVNRIRDQVAMTTIALLSSREPV